MTVNNNCAVTVAIVNFNGGQRLIETIQSLRAQTHVRVTLLLYDDGSTDNSALVAEQSGLVDEVHFSPVNTKCANRWRAAGMDAAQTDLVLITDNDVEFDASCLATLARSFERDATIAAVTPAIYDSKDRDRPYSLGGLIHFLGLTIRTPDVESAIVDSVG